MRKIKKRAYGGYHLKNADANPPKNSDEATSRWDNYNYKAELSDYLLDEQFFLCCYSELRADLETYPDGTRLDYHIEHIQPKSAYPKRTFDYQNLAASALSNRDLSNFKILNYEIFGGQAKLGEYEPNLFISCHQPDCARFFSYLSDGRVVPSRTLQHADRSKAEYTIKTLNLNSPYLVTKRKNWWDELDRLFYEHQNNNWSIEHLAAVDLVPTGNKLSQFFSLTRQFFGRIADHVLQEQK